MNSDSQFVMDWSERMKTRTGMCGAALCEVLYYASGYEETEQGDATPAAVTLAKQMEKSPSMIDDAIKEKDSWCMCPTWGCRFACDTPCRHIYHPEAAQAAEGSEDGSSSK